MVAFHVFRCSEGSLSSLESDTAEKFCVQSALLCWNQLRRNDRTSRISHFCNEHSKQLLNLFLSIKKISVLLCLFQLQRKSCYDTNNNGGRSDMTCWFGTALNLCPVASFSLVSPLTYDRLMKLRLFKIQWNSLDKEGLHFKRHSNSSFTIRKKK